MDGCREGTRPQQIDLQCWPHFLAVSAQPQSGGCTQWVLEISVCLPLGRSEASEFKTALAAYQLPV